MDAKDSTILNYENDDLQDTHFEKESDLNVKVEQYAGVTNTSFKDFMLKDELYKAICECGFEHPSEIQQSALSPALSGQDLLCQAKSGMGKTAIFIMCLLNCITPIPNQVSAVVLCNSHEMASQIYKEFIRFGKYLPDIKARTFIGGINIKRDISYLKKCPNIVIGTPGRVQELVNLNKLDISHVTHFVLDECDLMLETISMRQAVQKIFMKTPKTKQVILCSATISSEIKPICLKFLKNPLVIEPSSDKLVLNELSQYICKIAESQKISKLFNILDKNEFNQVVIYVKNNKRAEALNQILLKNGFPSESIQSNMSQLKRFRQLNKFKDSKKRLLITTDLFGRGIDVNSVNFVVNFDFPEKSDSYLHRVGRAGRFGTKGICISFVSSPEDQAILTETQNRFPYSIAELPADCVAQHTN